MRADNVQPIRRKPPMTAQTRADLAEVPGVAPIRDAATRGFVFNHTMLRVKDARASLDFYTRVLGFGLARKVDFTDAKFSLYFLVLVDDAGDLPDGDEQRRQWLAGQRGVLELTHNHGSEMQPGPVYHDGNSEPRGFGHLCVSVPDLRVACHRLEALNVRFQKKPGDGNMRDIAFIKDPDGYWIELIQPTPLAD
jgi:lactoylglutathione lyase